MKAFLLACVAVAVVAVIGAFVLSASNESVDKAYSVPSSVRVGAA
jgi:hypothetical protein